MHLSIGGVTHVLAKDAGCRILTWTWNVLALGGVEHLSLRGWESVSSLVRFCVDLSVLVGSERVIDLVLSRAWNVLEWHSAHHGRIGVILLFHDGTLDPW